MRSYSIYRNLVVSPIEFQTFLDQCKGGVIVHAGRGEHKGGGAVSRPSLSLVATYNLACMDALEPIEDNQSCGDRMGWHTACSFASGENGWFMNFTFFQDAEAKAFAEQFLWGKGY